MACRLIVAPSFSRLEQRLLAELCQGCSQDGLAPRWIIVPGSTLAEHLRLRLAKEAKREVVGGVRLCPITRFADRLASFFENDTPARWSPTLDLTLLELVEGLGKDSSLARIKTITDGHRLLISALLDLADAGFGLEHDEILVEIAAEPDLSVLEREVLLLYLAWVRLLRSRRLPWQPLVHQAVAAWIAQSDKTTLWTALAAERNQTVKLFFYGFYEWTDVNLQVINALARRVQITIFYPWARRGGDPHPAFEFGHPILEDLKLRLGSSLTCTEELTELVDSPASFFLTTFPEGEVLEQPSFLTFQRASGIRAEAISAALQIRRWLDESGLEPQDVLVTVPDPEAYLDSLREVFEAFAIPLTTGSSPTDLAPEERCFRMLARIWEERAPAEWLLAYLSECPRIGAARGVDVEVFETKVRSLNVWGGECWRFLLEMPPSPAENQTPWITFTPEDRALIQEIVNAWVPEELQEHIFSLSEAYQWLERLGRLWIPDPSFLDPILEAMRRAVREGGDLHIHESQLRQLVSQSVVVAGKNRFEHRQAVRLVPLMGARGLRAEGVVLLGLASEQFPFRIDHDPIIPETFRAKLALKASQIGHRLPLKCRIGEEMSLLFFLINSCAERVHWVVPEIDPSGRPITPTSWIQRYLYHWEKPTQRSSGEKRIPFGLSQQANYLHSLDPRGGSFLPPDFAVLVHPKLASYSRQSQSYSYLLDSRVRRDQDPEWNGWIPGAAFTAERKPLQRLSVTALESLARCPYRFYAEKVARWEAIRVLHFSEKLPSEVEGQLVHALLQQLFQPYCGQASSFRVYSIAEKLFQFEPRPLKKIAQTLSSQVSQLLMLLPPFLREIAFSQAEKLVTTYLEAVLSGECHDSQLLELEKCYRRTFMNGLEVTGVIDRVDRVNDDKRIVDYKSNSEPSTMAQDVRLGFCLQPLLYPWLMGTQEGGEDVRFHYLFLGNNPPKERSIRALRSPEMILKSLAGLVQRGVYVPTPDETYQLWEMPRAQPCRTCNVFSVCGRFDTLAGQRYARLFDQLARQRLEWITGEE